MAMAAFSRRIFIAAASSPFRFSVIRSVVSSGHIMRSLIAQRTTLGGNRAMPSTRSVNWEPKPPASSSPWLMLPPTIGSDKFLVYQFYSLADDKVVSLDKWASDEEFDVEDGEIPYDGCEILGSSHGWLALSDSTNGDLFLSNPISRRHIKLPPIHSLPHIPQEDLDMGFECVARVVISSSDPDNEDCRAMMTYGPTNELAFCCPSRRSTDWSPLRGETSSLFAYSSKRNLFLCGFRPDHSDIEAWDLRDPLSPSMTPISIAKIPRKVFSRSKAELEIKRLCDPDFSQFQFLVVKEGSDKEGSDEEIFHVRQYVLDRVGPDGSYVDNVWYGPSGGYDDSVPHKTVGFDVHKYDPETGSLVYMDGNLGGLALFVGPYDGGFALSPDDFPELKPNSIYYTDSMSTPDSVLYSGYDLGIFDYENATFSSCYYPCGLKSMFTKIEPIPRWFTPILPAN